MQKLHRFKLRAIATASRLVEYYSLDAIIAVCYRVNSKKATRFRQWAAKTLPEYIQKGLVLNGELLKNDKPFGKDYKEVSPMQAYMYLPNYALHPKHYRRLTAAEFEALENLEEAGAGGSCIEGHLGTDYWQHEQLGFIIQAHFQDRPDVIIIPYCHCPFALDDMIDRNFIADALAYAYELTFDRHTDRLQIFAERGDSIEIFEYLEARGIHLK